MEPVKRLCLSVLCLTLLAGGAMPARAAESGAATGGQGRTLQDFFSAAMDHNPALQIAEERVDIGGARRRAANGQLLPQLNATGSVSQNTQTAQGVESDFRGERYGLQLRQVLFNWQAFSRRGRAYAQENQYEAEYYQQLATIFTDVAERYFDVLEAQDAVTSIEAELRAIRNQMNQVQRMRELEMVPITDLYDVQARLASLEAERLNLRSEVEVARQALRAASGLGVGELFGLGDEVELPAPEGTPEEWAERAQAANHQIAARESALEVADSRVSESRSAYMPEVSLVAQYQDSNLGFDNRRSNRTETEFYGVNVTIPLFAGGSNRAAVSEAVSQRSIARHELRQARLDVTNQARQLAMRLRSNEQRIAAAEQTVEAAEVAAESRQRSYDLGNTTSVELLNAIRDRFRAERDLQSLRYEQIKLGLRLQRAGGELEAEDMVEISNQLQPPVESDSDPDASADLPGNGN